MRSYIKVLTMCFLGLILFVPTALADNSVKRVGGSNRYGTAVQISKQMYSTASTAVRGVPMQMLFQQHLLLTRRMRHCFTLILISFHMKRKQD